MNRLSEEQIQNGLDAAYKKAGSNAYFGEGFQAGVEFIMNQGKSDDLCDILGHNADIVMSGECSNCGSNVELYDVID